jgi:RNA polymerase sigma factor (TIGR02999 family)
VARDQPGSHCEKQSGAAFSPGEILEVCSGTLDNALSEKLVNQRHNKSHFKRDAVVSLPQTQFLFAPGSLTKIMHSMSDATQLLKTGGDDPKAAAELLPLVYEELRRLAAAKLTREKQGQTLQATALVHEAWLRLAGSNHQRWRGRAHFFGAAAEAMRRVLIDKARQKASLKCGAGRSPEELHESIIPSGAPSDEMLAVHEALDRLAAEDALAATVVKLRYFVGMTVPEIAEALEISQRSADRHWAFARAWLKTALSHR